MTVWKPDYYKCSMEAAESSWAAYSKLIDAMETSGRLDHDILSAVLGYCEAAENIKGLCWKYWMNSTKEIKENR